MHLKPITETTVKTGKAECLLLDNLLVKLTCKICPLKLLWVISEAITGADSPHS